MGAGEFKASKGVMAKVWEGTTTCYKASELVVPGTCLLGLVYSKLGCSAGSES